MEDKAIALFNRTIKDKGVTKKFIANKLGLTEQSFLRRLSGETSLKIGDFCKICEVLDLDAKKTLQHLINNK